MSRRFRTYGRMLWVVLLLTACGGSTYTVGGTVTGLVGTVVLQNNGTYDLSISANGPFTFAGHFTSGSTYNVTVFSQPTNQICTVSAGSGKVNSAVTSVIVNCAINSPPRFAYVANSFDGTISQYAIDTGGALKAMTTATVPAGTTPNFIAVDRLSATYAYVVNSGSKDIWQYAIGKTDGALNKIAVTSLPVGSMEPYSITIDSSSTHAYVVDSGSGNVYQYIIGISGALDVASVKTVLAGTNPRSIAIHPSGRYAYVVNSGSNDIWQYSIDANGTVNKVSSLPAGSAPYAITIATSPSGSGTYYAYVANSGGSNVLQYTIDKNGNLNAMTTTAVSAGMTPYSVAVDPLGKYAYVANSGNGSSVSQYTIQEADGSLKAMNPTTAAAGTTPRSVTVDPSGQYVYTANYGSSNISQYTIGGGGALVSNTAAATVPAGVNPAFIITVR